MSSEAPDNGPVDLAAGQKTHRRGHPLSTLKVNPKLPAGSYNLELIEVSLDEIRGLDPDVEQFLIKQDFNFQSAVDFKIWAPDAARLAYLIAPMVLIRRASGFDVLGSGRAWRIAQMVFDSNSKKLPALVLRDTKRISAGDKLQFVAVELFSFYADFRTRPHLPRKLLSAWKGLNEAGIQSIVGNDSQAFSRGTGFSLGSLSPSSKPGQIE